MADDDKKPVPAPDSAPAPEAGSKAAPDATTPETPPPAPASNLVAEPLTDGTVPTVLQKGDAAPHAAPPEGKRNLGSVYRRADIITTLITFGATVAVCALAFGGYLYLTRSTAKTATPKVTTLDQADLSKLGAFFQGDTAGGSSQVLTFNSSSYFKGQVAVAGDLKVSGAASVDGPSTLSDLTVNKTSTLGITNVRGQLTVSGPLNLQSPATLSGGGTVTGNLAVSGNGSFGGSVSAGVVNATTLQVTGNLNLSGHLVINGIAPTVSVNAGAGPGATASIDGNDSAGTVTINTGNIPVNIGQGAQLVQINFHSAYGKVPRVLITAVGSPAGSLNSYVQKTNNMFIIGSATNPTSNTSYTFDYWVVQ
ncbi:hypothetical protein HJC99_04415 [Candidatus Saccharibacteria bacterium]|nr:hypothetical protein [Candidatus Saccharibacteria bacterium]